MIKNLTVKIKKLSNLAQIPAYGSVFAAGADLYSAQNETIIPPHETVTIKTGLSIEIPEGYVGLIYARSGLATKKNLAPANKVGVIDSDYRGEVLVALHNHGDNTMTVALGDRIAQIIFTEYYKATFTLSETLSDTERGLGGFGSTGK